MCVEWCKPSCVDAPYVNRHALFILKVCPANSFIHLYHTMPPIRHHGQNISHDSPHNDIFHVATTLLNHFLQVYKMLAQNPDGDTVTAQEFATANRCVGVR
jgi:hypothetical protein